MTNLTIAAYTAAYATARSSLAAERPGAVGDSYDSAMAESIIGLFKTEVIRRRGPWRNLDDVEIATLEQVDWVQQSAPLRGARQHPSLEPRPTRSTTSQSPALGA